MVKKTLIVLFLFLFVSTALAEDIVIPEGILTPEDIQQAQDTIQGLSTISGEIEAMKGYVEERTNLLASYVGTQLLQLTSFLIVVIIISNICTGLMILGIVLYLKSKRRW